MYEIKGTAPNMENYDKLDDMELETAMDEYIENMGMGALEGEIQVLYADRSPVDGIEVMFFIAQNSVEVTNTSSIKEYVEAGYEYVLTYAGDEYHTLLSRIPNLEDYIY